MENVQQRVAVVTGGNRGIGLAVARQLAQRGVHVVLAARDVTKSEAEVADLRAQNLSASCRMLDVTDDASVRAFADYVRLEFGRLDILINNAGIALDKWVPSLELDLELLRQTYEVNVFGALRVLQALVPMMKEAGSGRVVNLSSELGSLELMSGCTAAYRSSKAALNVLTRVFAAECKNDGLLVNSACPGWVRTAMGGEEAPREPAEAADGIVWLATLPDDGPTGGFFQDRKWMPW